MSVYVDDEFRSKVDESLKIVATILDTTRNPQRFVDVPHTYDNKFDIVIQSGNSTIVALFNTLSKLGLEKEQIALAQSWQDKNQSVTLRMSSVEECSFIKKQTRKVDSKVKHVIEHESSILPSFKLSSKSSEKITEWLWKCKFTWQIVLFPANQPELAVTLCERTGKTKYISTTEHRPAPEKRNLPNLDVSLTWLFANSSFDVESDIVIPKFKINRTVKSCHTPRRNQPVNTALSFLQSVSSWAMKVDQYFRLKFIEHQNLDGFDVDSTSREALPVFVPVLPIAEPQESGPSKLLTKEDEQRLLSAQSAQLDTKLKKLDEQFASIDELLSPTEAKTLFLLGHLMDVCRRYGDVVNEMEAQLYKQLKQAIGDKVTATAFGEYMQFHTRKLFLKEYRPAPFQHAIRRPSHAPEGILSMMIDKQDDSIPIPLQTIAAQRMSTTASPIYCRIDAATKAALVGEQFLHGAILHAFSGSSIAVQLEARARQFSSFILMVGRVVSHDEFVPSHAVIVQNKDHLIVPLLLEALPSAKAFRDAIESLSPEMQRFARQFREMQLSGTVFGIAVIQIKPHLEKLLNLPFDSLTKEIELTQHLIELFVKYQIPADLISFDADCDTPEPSIDNIDDEELAEFVMIQKPATNKQKIRAVKRHVAELQSLIDTIKGEELSEQAKKHDYAVMDEIATNNNSAVIPEKPVLYDGSVTRQRKSRGVRIAHKIKKILRSPRGHKSYALPSSAVLESRQSDAAPHDASDAAPSEQSPSQPISNQTGEEQDASVVVDYTRYPIVLDGALDSLEIEGSVRPTKVDVSNTWRKKFQQSLLSEQEETTLGDDELHTEKNAAFDLIDALSKSGELVLDHTSLHIVIATTHQFDKSLLDTLIQENVNPIEQSERLSCIVGSIVHNVKPLELIEPSQKARLLKYSPMLANADEKNKLLKDSSSSSSASDEKKTKAKPSIALKIDAPEK